MYRISSQLHPDTFGAALFVWNGTVNKRLCIRNIEAIYQPVQWYYSGLSSLPAAITKTRRITAHSGGNDIVPEKLDTTSSAWPAAVEVRGGSLFEPTGDSFGRVGSVLSNCSVALKEIATSPVTMSAKLGMRDLWRRHDSNTQAITLRPGEGIGIYGDFIQVAQQMRLLMIVSIAGQSFVVEHNHMTPIEGVGIVSILNTIGSGVTVLIHSISLYHTGDREEIGSFSLSAAPMTIFRTKNAPMSGMTRASVKMDSIDDDVPAGVECFQNAIFSGIRNDGLYDNFIPAFRLLNNEDKIMTWTLNVSPVVSGIAGNAVNWGTARKAQRCPLGTIVINPQEGVGLFPGTVLFHGSSGFPGKPNVGCLETAIDFDVEDMPSAGGNSGPWGMIR